MIGTFTFGKKSKRLAKPGGKTPWKPLEEKKEEVEIRPIQGIMPDSKEEFFIANSLYKYKWRFEFQKAISGGRSRRRGMVIDFWVETPPVITIISVKGWRHTTVAGRERDRLQQADIKRKYGNQVVWKDLWWYLCDTQEKSDAWIRKNIT